ncbi:SHOCT domain-containing protein [Zafaria sp. Z1313]|uniref:SHOCT domain-containing protein n=1 Tax=Zafaria sp. Z1313 TaxID=3423202 RepID=UPI003D3027A9
MFLPLLTALVYLVVRGRTMAVRTSLRQQEAQEATEHYIRSFTAPSPAEEISRAKALLDSGTVSADEFEQLKKRALAGAPA